MQVEGLTQHRDALETRLNAAQADVQVCVCVCSVPLPLPLQLPSSKPPTTLNLPPLAAVLPSEVQEHPQGPRSSPHQTLS